MEKTYTMDEGTAHYLIGILIGSLMTSFLIALPFYSCIRALMVMCASVSLFILMDIITNKKEDKIK